MDAALVAPSSRMTPLWGAIQHGVEVTKRSSKSQGQSGRRGHPQPMGDASRLSPLSEEAGGQDFLEEETLCSHLVMLSLNEDFSGQDDLTQLSLLQNAGLTSHAPEELVFSDDVNEKSKARSFESGEEVLGALEPRDQPSEVKANFKDFLRKAELSVIFKDAEEFEQLWLGFHSLVQSMSKTEWMTEQQACQQLLELLEETGIARLLAEAYKGYRVKEFAFLIRCLEIAKSQHDRFFAVWTQKARIEQDAFYLETLKRLLMHTMDSLNRSGERDILNVCDMLVGLSCLDNKIKIETADEIHAMHKQRAGTVKLDEVRQQLGSKLTKRFQANL